MCALHQEPKSIIFPRYMVLPDLHSNTPLCDPIFGGYPRFDQHVSRFLGHLEVYISSIWDHQRFWANFAEFGRICRRYGQISSDCDRLRPHWARCRPNEARIRPTSSAGSGTVFDQHRVSDACPQRGKPTPPPACRPPPKAKSSSSSGVQMASAGGLRMLAPPPAVSASMSVALKAPNALGRPGGVAKGVLSWISLGTCWVVVAGKVGRSRKIRRKLTRPVENWSKSPELAKFAPNGPMSSPFCEAVGKTCAKAKDLVPQGVRRASAAWDGLARAPEGARCARSPPVLLRSG